MEGLGLGISIAGGSISLAAIVHGIIKWSLARNISHEDGAKAAFESRIKALESITADQAIKLSESIGGVSRMTETLGEIRGTLRELRSQWEETRDKQSAFYRSELEKLETAIRQELSRHIHPDLPERMAALEAAVETKPRKPRK